MWSVLRECNRVISVETRNWERREGEVERERERKRERERERERARKAVLHISKRLIDCKKTGFQRHPRWL